MKKPASPSFSFNERSNKPGQSIIEIVLSIGVAALVIAALVVLGNISLRTALSSARRAEATRLAISGLEAMRFYRDSQGYSNLTPRCYEILANGSIAFGTNMNPSADPTCTQESSGWANIDLTNSSSRAIFNRKIRVVTYGNSTESSRMRKIITTVRWTETGGNTIAGAADQKSVVMTMVLSQWQP